MQWKKGEYEVVIRLDKGEEIQKSVIEVCKAENIKSAYISGIGSLKNAEIAHYDTVYAKYGSGMFEGMFEIASMTGNISTAEDKHIAHIHIVLGKSDFSTVGGHLVSGIVGPTCEIILLPLETQIKREKDKKTGLMLTKF